MRSCRPVAVALFRTTSIPSALSHLRSRYVVIAGGRHLRNPRRNDGLHTDGFNGSSTCAGPNAARSAGSLNHPSAEIRHSTDNSGSDRRGIEHQRLADIPIRSDARSVVFQQSITWAKASPSATMVARLLAVDDKGDERLLGEYTFHHERTIPGPPGWELP